MKKNTALILLFLLSSFGAAPAQVTTGISGVVTDQTGAALPSVNLSVKSAETGLVRAASSDSGGYYSFAGLPAGRYVLAAEAPGMTKSVREVVTNVGQLLKLNIFMTLEGIKEEAYVKGEIPLIDPAKTEVSEMVDRRQIEDLPIAGRNFVDFAKSSSSAVSSGRDIRGGGALLEPDTGIGSAAAPRLSFGGQREYYTLLLIDGLDNTQTVTGLTRAVPSQEIVQEFRILNGTYSAEFGRAPGGIVNIITRSGTDSYKGSAYYFLMNDRFNARSALKRPDADRLRQNQFGFTLGGPIITQRTFFLANVEGQRYAESNQFSSVILENIGAINRIREGFGLTPETNDLLRTNDYNQAFLRVDHRARPGHSLSLRYNVLDSDTENFLGAAGRTASASSSARDNFVRDQSLSANLISVISPKAVNEASFQYARRSFDFPYVRSEPTLEIPNLITMGKSSSDIDAYTETRLQWTDSLSYSTGRHSLKLGFDLNHVRDSVRWEIFFPARVIFPGLAGFLGVGPFPGPTPVAFQWSAGPGAHPGLDAGSGRAVPREWDDLVRYRFNQGYHGLFAQDRWAITPRLTLNYGVRYDFDVYPEDTFKGDYNNFQPRVGVAFSINDKAVVRAGFGVFSGRRTSWSNIVAGAIIGLRGNPPIAGGLGDFIEREASISNFILSGPPLAGPAFANLLATGNFPTPERAKLIATPIEADNRTPYTEQATLGFSFEMPRETAVSVDYFFVRGVKLQASRNVNAFQNGVSPDGRPLFAGRFDPNYLFLQSAPNWGNSFYHGGTVSVRKNLRGNLGFNAGYTFSKTIDDIGGSHDIGAMPPYIDRRLERAISNQHVGHRLAASLLVDAGREGPLRNFKLGTIVTAESPRYYTVYVGSDANLDGNPLNDRPGALGRNTFKGDGFFGLDARVSRTLRLGERLSLDLIGECFNLFNTLNVKDFNTVFGSTDLAAKPPDLLGFGEPREVSGARRLQFSVKVNF